MTTAATPPQPPPPPAPARSPGRGPFQGANQVPAPSRRPHHRVSARRVKGQVRSSSEFCNPAPCGVRHLGGAYIQSAGTLFSDDAMTLAHDAARGLPRAINNIATQALLAARKLRDQPNPTRARGRRPRRPARRLGDHSVAERATRFTSVRDEIPAPRLRRPGHGVLREHGVAWDLAHLLYIVRQ